MKFKQIFAWNKNIVIENIQVAAIKHIKKSSFKKENGLDTVKRFYAIQNSRILPLLEMWTQMLNKLTMVSVFTSIKW